MLLVCLLLGEDGGAVSKHPSVLSQKKRAYVLYAGELTWGLISEVPEWQPARAGSWYYPWPRRTKEGGDGGTQPRNTAVWRKLESQEGYFTEARVPRGNSNFQRGHLRHWQQEMGKGRNTWLLPYSHPASFCQCPDANQQPFGKGALGVCTGRPCGIWSRTGEGRVGIRQQIGQ